MQTQASAGYKGVNVPLAHQLLAIINSQLEQPLLHQIGASLGHLYRLQPLSSS